jgi:two-component system, cell cycle response regulator
MASMDGIEFCRNLRELKLPHYVYVILLTSKSHEDDLITGLSAGADDFLTKPFSHGELTARLQTAVRILELESRLNELARRDPLTGVLNRRTFHEVVQREWSRAVRYRHPLSCVMVDIDYFKRVNDTYGHLVGDHVLKFLAQSLEGQSRCPDYVCRWGGEEFCILLPETDEQGARLWAERCCWAIAEADISSDEHCLTMTASFGVAERQEDLQTPEQLLHRADQALYAAKRAGRHRVVSFGSIEEQPSVLETDLDANAELVGAL